MNVFRRFETLSFDCYGTLIDWETGIRTALEPTIRNHGLDTNEVIKQFGQTERLVQSELPTVAYPEILAEVFRRIGSANGLEVTEKTARAFGLSIGEWPSFPDSTQALKRLKKKFRLAILSNVDRASFAKSSRHLGVGFDVIVTAEDVGSYKPNQQNFLDLFERLELEDRSSLLHVAQSLFHDHQPALALGLETVWINRPSAGATPLPPEEVTPTWIFPSMAAFADAAT
jgi:2-haloalkanoic acid dehalogenase type II